MPNVKVHLARSIVLGVVAAAWTGCHRDSPPPVVHTPPPLAQLPVEVTLRQRTTADVPGSGGRLRLTIDDVTAGQVMTSLSDENGRVVLPVTSLEQGEAATFKLADQLLQIELTELSNALIGDDFAGFVVSNASGEPPGSDTAAGPERVTETGKIERLLAMVESAEGDVFIRNGQEHAAKDAAGHLRRKWKAAGKRVTTVDEFIDHVASGSSLSGEPYGVRKSDGMVVTANEYLREKLKALDRE
jgi:hypothetical protein